jgi:DNA repair exonuclease SbcCD ATPase subunit
LSNLNELLNNSNIANNKNLTKEIVACFSDYSKEATKMALSQSQLNATQIKAVLVSKGLQGELLKTTTDEIANTASANAMAAAEGTATTATVGFGTAIKGLGASLKSLAAAHPVLLAITAAIGAIYATVKIVDACTTSFDELKDKISNLKQDVSDSESTLKDYKTQLDEINQKITEINNQDSLSFTDEQELENLKNQKTELENMYNIEKARHDLKQKELEDTANKYFNKKITPSLSKEYKDYSVVDEDGFEKKLTKLDIMNLAKERMLLNQSRLDTLNEEYNNKSNPSNKEAKEYEKKKAQLEKTRNDAKKTALDIQEEAKEQVEGLDSTSDTYKKVTEASQELSDALARLNNDWDSLSDKGKREDLSSKISKEAKNLSSDDMKNIDNYLSTLSDDDLNILANVTFDENTTVESLKEVIKAAQEEANKSSVDLPVKTFDPTSLLEESDDKTKTATLADLQSEADLLSSIQKELSETGRIGVDSMQKIIKQYPEAKDALGQYMLGIISQEELFDQLQGVYEDDKNAYIYSLVEKSKYDGTFYSNLVNTNNDFFAGLSEAYGEDFSNYKNLAQAKQKIDDQLIKYLSGMWGKFYQTTIDTATGLMSLTSKATSMDDDMDLGLYLYDNGADEETNAIAEMQKMVDDYNALQNISFESAFNGIDLSWQGFSGDDSSSSNDSSSSQSAEKLNWIERLINKISTAYSRLKNVVSDTTTTWLNRNNALSDSMSTLVDEINTQSDAYEYYMNAFNSYGLDEYYKNQIADGSISIDVIYDDDLKDAISDCQDFYDKAQDAKTAVQELNIELKGLAKSRFDNVASEFEEKINKIVAVRDLYSKEDELMNEKGWFSSTLLNSAMIDQENKNLQKLEAERDALVNALNSAVNSGSIMPESEDWYSMQSAIDEVSSSILDAKKALVEYDNTIRQINWDAFDRTRDDVENLITETDFLTELLKDVGITDDNGNMTKEGQAAQALLAQKYQLYLNQAKAYKDEIAKIDADLANNPYDKELLDRKQDLIDKEQEAIKSAMSEKDAIKNLTNDAYNDFIDKLGDAIDKYKELMSTMKDAYDYEKSIREKTEALNALEKQYSAYQGDNSEEGKKNIQQLKDQINSAKDDLKDTEYEKLISDTEKILDQLKDNTQEWLNQRLDQLDNLIQDIIDQSNDNASDIAETITSTAENYGYKLSESMASIWSTNTGNITKVLDNFSTSFIDSNSKIKDVCDNINSAVQGLLANSNAEAQRVADEIARQQAEQNASSDGGYSGGNDYSGDDWSGNWDTGSDDNDSSGSDGVDWIYSKDYFDKNSLNIDTSIVDRLKLHDYDSSFAARSQYYDQMGGEGQYYATYDQNVWMLDWMKSHGYRKGTKSAISGLHIYDEDDPGSEVLVTKYGVLRQFDSGDTVFNKDQVEKLWNLSKGITTPNMYMDNLGAKLPDISNMSNNLSNKVDVQFGDVTLSLPNVRNYEDFMKEAQKDPKFEKMIQNMTLGQTLGRNSLNKLTFR